MQHPFIQAVQSALDTHGLPDGVDMLTIGRSGYRATGIHAAVWLTGGAESKSQDTLPLAMIAATEAHKQHEAKVAAMNAARAALVAAGFDPALIAA